MRKVRQRSLNVIAAALAVLASACGSTLETTTTGAADARDAIVLQPPPRPELAAGTRAPETFPSRDLIGLTLPELRTRLGRGLLIGEISPMLVVAQADGPPLSFLTLDDALADPWAAANARIGAAPASESTSCTAMFGPTINPQAASASRALLIFRGEVLSEIRHPQNIRRAPEERPTRGAGGRTPVEHVFLTEPGQLPLADGSEFLRRWHSPRVTANEQITVRCELRRPAAAPASASAAAAQSVALAPLTVFMPGPIATPLAEGPTTAALLKLGQPVAGGAADFGSKHKRASYSPGKDGYGILAIDMAGDRAKRTYMTFAGVRNDRVVWIAQEGGGIGMASNLMCLDENFVPGRARAGCSDSGDFAPAR